MGVAAATGEVDPLSQRDFIGKWMPVVRLVAETVPCAEGSSKQEHYRLIERTSVVHSLANLRSFPWINALETKGELPPRRIVPHGTGRTTCVYEASHGWLSAAN